MSITYQVWDALTERVAPGAGWARAVELGWFVEDGVTGTSPERTTAWVRSPAGHHSREIIDAGEIPAALDGVLAAQSARPDPREVLIERNRAAAAASPNLCQCGCGASWRGWSDYGRARGFRVGVERVYADTHPACRWCGLNTDQYGQCRECEDVS